MTPRLRPAHSLLLALAASALLAGCGGDQIARTGSGGTGIASTGGTVTGFGSVVVDGERWDDRNARIETEQAGRAVPTDARLGQRVEIEYETRGRAERIVVAAELIGRVSEVAAAATPPSLRVAGQWVRVNLDPDAGPLTYLQGVAGLNALQPGDVVEVHGSARHDPALDRAVVIATRIERLPALPGGLVRVTGQVQALDAGASRFRLGDLTVTLGSGARVLPASRALANGQRVVVWSDEAVGGSTAAPTLTADAVRIVERGGSDPARAEVAGVVSRYSAASASFEVDGLPVNARSAVVVPASQSLADGRYVVVSGRVENGVLQARQVKIRSRSGSDIEVEVAGTITEFSSTASFRARGVAINAAGLTALPGCGAGGLANGVFVEVEGRIGAGDERIVATRLRCEANPVDRVQSFEGIAGSVNIAGRSFTLAGPGNSSRSVSWSATTGFVGVTPETLANRSVVVDGRVQAGTLVATRIRAR